jgi:hypothetical protein
MFIHRSSVIVNDPNSDYSEPKLKFNLYDAIYLGKKSALNPNLSITIKAKDRLSGPTSPDIFPPHSIAADLLSFSFISLRLLSAPCGA